MAWRALSPCDRPCEVLHAHRGSEFPGVSFLISQARRSPCFLSTAYVPGMALTVSLRVASHVGLAKGKWTGTPTLVDADQSIFLEGQDYLKEEEGKLDVNQMLTRSFYF